MKITKLVNLREGIDYKSANFNQETMTITYSYEFFTPERKSIFLTDHITDSVQQAESLGWDVNDLQITLSSDFYKGLMYEYNKFAPWKAKALAKGKLLYGIYGSYREIRINKYNLLPKDVQVTIAAYREANHNSYIKFIGDEVIPYQLTLKKTPLTNKAKSADRKNYLSKEINRLKRRIGEESTWINKMVQLHSNPERRTQITESCKDNIRKWVAEKQRHTEEFKFLLTLDKKNCD